MIKVITFDIGDTIYKVPYSNIVQKISSKYKISKQKIKEVMAATFQISNDTLSEVSEQFCNMLNISDKHGIYSMFKQEKDNQTKSEYIDPKMYSLIKKYKNKGYKIALLSNSSMLYSDMIDDNLKSQADFILRSYNLGVTKKQQAFFEIAQVILKAKPNQILHIGDNYVCDYKVPKQCGWNAILFKYNSPEHEVNTVEKLDQQIQSVLTNSPTPQQEASK